ncbi:MAG: toll/interleukin-1 receptor domain-containing protein [Prevotellaceae bacterium]|nr:toll/interleukin-1 receptor domain-containing protein [Prevotellaceae bacterium]
MERIFISYKRVDKEMVFRIKDQIEVALDEKCWIDLDGIESDAQFANVIIKAINQANVFLFMYSSAHAQIEDYDNDWTVREINFAQKKKKRIVFINIDGTPLTDWFELMFGTKQQIDALSKV